MNRHASLEKFEKWSFRKLIMFSEEKKNPTEFSNLDYRRNVLGWLSGTNRWLVGYMKMYRSVQEYRKIQCFHFCGKLWKGSLSQNPNSSSEMNKGFIISANLNSIIVYFHMWKMREKNLDRRNPHSIEFRARQKLDHFSNSAPQNLPDRPYRKHCECLNVHKSLGLFFEVVL